MMLKLLLACILITAVFGESGKECESRKKELEKKGDAYEVLCSSDPEFRDCCSEIRTELDRMEAKWKGECECEQHPYVFPGGAQGGHVSVNTNPSMNSITACFWVNSSQKSSYYLSYTATIGDTSYINEYVVHSQNGVLYLVVGDNSAMRGANINVNDGQWHAVCTSYTSDRNAYKIYVDGALKQSIVSLMIGNKFTGYVIKGNGKWHLGRAKENAFEGEIISANIWNRLLSAEDIKKYSSNCQVKMYGNVRDWEDFEGGERNGNVKFLANSCGCEPEVVS